MRKKNIYSHGKSVGMVGNYSIYAFRQIYTYIYMTHALRNRIKGNKCEIKIRKVWYARVYNLEVCLERV